MVSFRIKATLPTAEVIERAIAEAKAEVEALQMPQTYTRANAGQARREMRAEVARKFGEAIARNIVELAQPIQSR